MPETTPTNSAIESSADATTEAKPAEVVVRYRYADGILLEGDTYPHRNEVKKALPRWRWFRSLRKWGVPRTRERALSSYQVEEYARGLTKAGVPNVRVDYQEPRPEDVRDFDEVVEERKERALARADRLEDRADRHDATAAEEYGKHRAVLDRIPMGQPILVGHHSEKRHRRDLRRADDSMRRSIEATQDAARARRGASAAKHSAAREESPRFALRRVLELAKEARGIQVKITGEVPTGWKGLNPGGSATGEYLARLRTAAEENRQKDEHYRRVLDEKGYRPTDSTVLRPGDRVLTNKGNGVVLKTLSRLAEIRFDKPVGMDGPRLKYVQRIAYERVWVPKATVERREGGPPRQASTTPARSAARAPERAPTAPAAAPTTPDATAAPASPTTADELLAKHADPDHYTGQQLTDALVEAERIGAGSRLAQQFRSKLRDEDVVLAYGRARGIVAFEGDAWPPAPLRGETYGKDDFRGILLSLDHHPVVVELSAEIQTWPERMKAATAGRHVQWFPRVIRNATSVVHDNRAHYELEVARGKKATPELARAARDAVVASAKRQLHELREAQDPSLYDAKSDPKAVYPRLCKLDTTAARMVLEDVFGVEFHWEDKDEEASELCDGEITLETLAEGAAQRTKEDEARKEHERAQREVDARELMRVHRDAASRGEVTKGRFNAAYWRLHPGFEKAAGNRRAITVTEQGGKVAAVVRGPLDWGFGVTLPGGTDEQAAIAALMRRIEREAGEVGTGETTTPGKTTRKAEPTKVDVEAIAKKHGIGPSLLSGNEIHPALVEAERLGAGQQLAHFVLKKKLRHPDYLKVDLGRARGRVALENGTWPPPPMRGAVYGKHDFEGIIRSLEHHPLVVELHQEASTWAERMKPITADRARNWFPRLVEQARLVVYNHLDVHLHHIRYGKLAPRPGLAGKIRDYVLRDTEKLLENLRDALDPSLYDPKSDPEAVYPRLCKIDFASTRLVMIDVFGVPFEDRSETYALCRGDTSLDEVNRKAKARKEESERRAAAQQTKREADARALVAVYRRAEKLGEVTRKRFNLAYWRQHPELRPWQRESRALTVRARHGVVEVSVRGPGEHGFYTTAKSGTGEPETIAVLMREIEQEAGKPSGTPSQPTHADAAVPEVKKGTEAIEEKPMQDEPEDTKDRTTAEAPPQPRGEAAPGSLWTVEEEGFALVAPPGEGSRVHVPTGHQPPLFDVGKPDPAVLERMRAEELAERRAKRPPPDTSDPLLVQATNDPPPPPSSTREEESPIETMLPLRPWAGEIQTVANRMGPEGRYGSERVFISAVWQAVQGQPKLAGPSLDAFKARLVQANRESLLRLHRADLVGAMDPALVRESETRHLNATFHFIETPPVLQPITPRGGRPYGTRPADLVGVGAKRQSQVRAILTNRIADDGPQGVSEFSTKHEPGMVRAAKAMAKRGEVKIISAPRGYLRIMAGPKWGSTDEPKPKTERKPKPKTKPKAAASTKQKGTAPPTPKVVEPDEAGRTRIREGDVVAFEHHESAGVTRFGIVVRHLVGQRTAEVMAPHWFPLSGATAIKLGHQVSPTKKYHLHLLTNRVRRAVASDIGADGLRLMKRSTTDWVDLRPVGGGPSWHAFVALRNVGLIKRIQDVDLGGQDGDLPGPPFVVEPTELGQKVLASLDPVDVNLTTRRYVPPRRKDMGKVFPVGDDLGGPDEVIRFYVLEDTFVPTEESRAAGYPVGKVVAYTDRDTWHVLHGFTLGPRLDVAEAEWDGEDTFGDEWKARSAISSTSGAQAASDPRPPKPATTIAPLSLSLSPALARRVRAEHAKLHQMPKHQDPSFRPVVVVAWEGRRADVLSRYHTAPVGTLVVVDGYDRAQVVAELEPRPPNGGGTSPPSTSVPSESSPPLDSFEEDLIRSVIDMGGSGLEPENPDETRALEGMAGRGLVEKTDENRYRATPLARLEYVDVATGVPTDPSEPGTLSTGRIIADIDGETIEVDEEDLIGRGTDPDPRKRQYHFDVDSPVDYPRQAQAKKAARKEAEPGTKKGKAKNGKSARAGLRTTFDSPAKAAAIFYEHNEDFFDNVIDPWDGLRDWMDGIEVRVGRGHRKLLKTRTGQKILGEKHASRAIRGALAYLMGQAKGRRWDAVPWAQVERLGEALGRYFEAPSSGPAQAGLYWRPFTGTVRAEDLDAMTPEQRASIREQESVREIGEQLDELKEAYDLAKGCMPEDLRRVIERRIAEWSRWVADPSKIPEYACEPDPATAGYLCNYPAVAGELAQLRRSCEDAYDPNWAAKESKEGAPGFPDTSRGEDEEPPSRTASAKACCSRATPKEEVCSAPACQIAAGLMADPGAGDAADTSTGEATQEPTTKAAPKPAKPSSKVAKPPGKATPKKPTTAKKAPRPATAKQAAPKATTKPKREPRRKSTAAERKKALAERKKALEQRRKQTAAERRAQRFECSASVAMKQAQAIDTTSYRRRVEDAAAAVKKAEEHVKHHERDLKTALREADAVMRNRKAIPMDREVARHRAREARCQLSVAQGTLRQRRRDHQRAQTELQRALQRVKRREAVAAKRLEETNKAKAEASALAQKRR